MKFENSEGGGKSLKADISFEVFITVVFVTEGSERVCQKLRDCFTSMRHTENLHSIHNTCRKYTEELEEE